MIDYFSLWIKILLKEQILNYKRIMQYVMIKMKGRLDLIFLILPHHISSLIINYQELIMFFCVLMKN